MALSLLLFSLLAVLSYGLRSQHVNQRGDDEYPFKLWLLEKSNLDGKCLDGSSGGYYYKEGSGDGKNKFIVYLQGGGWCYWQSLVNPTDDATLADCYDRSLSNLGSSKDWWSTQAFDGLLDTNWYNNPSFYNWNMVYIPYCDGTSFSSSLRDPVPYRPTGSHSSTGLYFQGQRILQNSLLDLQRNYGWFTGADNIVLTGGSAGAAAVFYQLHFVTELLQEEVIGMPDAGLFLNLPAVNGTSVWPEQMKSVMTLSNATLNVDSRCLAHYADTPENCLFPEYYAEFMTEPMFIFQSLYDTSETSCTLVLSCNPSKSNCSDEEEDAFDSLYANHIAVLGSFPGDNKGFWWISCLSHTLSWWALQDTEWTIPANSGNTLQAGIGAYLGGEPARFIDSVPYPLNAPCADWS